MHTDTTSIPNAIGAILGDGKFAIGSACEGVLPAVEFAQVVSDDSETWVEIVIVDDIACPGCGQAVRVSGPVQWIDNHPALGLTENGSWSQQHGCGHWQSRTSNIVRLENDIDTEAAETVLRAAALDLMEIAREDIAADHAAIRRELTNSLEDFMDSAAYREWQALTPEAKLDAIADGDAPVKDDDYPATRGLFYDATADGVYAWAPAYHTNEEGITVTADTIEREDR